MGRALLQLRRSHTHTHMRTRTHDAFSLAVCQGPIASSQSEKRVDLGNDVKIPCMEKTHLSGLGAVRWERQDEQLHLKTGLQPGTFFTSRPSTPIPPVLPSQFKRHRPKPGRTPPSHTDPSLHASFLLPKNCHSQNEVLAAQFSVTRGWKISTFKTEILSR